MKQLTTIIIAALIVVGCATFGTSYADDDAAHSDTARVRTGSSTINNDWGCCDSDCEPYSAVSLGELRKACEENDAEAQLEMSVRYAHGRGVPKNSREAKKWIRSAAKNGSTQAQYLLGSSAWLGHILGKAESISNVVHWLSLAADAGCAEAQYFLGSVIEDKNVGAGLEDAIKMYKLAADQGSQEAQDALLRLANPNYKYLQFGRAEAFNFIMDRTNRVALDNSLRWFRKAADAELVNESETLCCFS